jgi:hypothetical protein
LPHLIPMIHALFSRSGEGNWFVSTILCMSGASIHFQIPF